MYKAILFDLDDTLFSLRGCEAQALRRTLDDTPGFWSLYAANYAERLTRAISAMAIGRRGLWTTTRHIQPRKGGRVKLARFLVSAMDLDRKQSSGRIGCRASGTEFCRSSALNPCAKACFASSVSRSYRLGMITNGYSDSQRGRLGKRRACWRPFRPAADFGRSWRGEARCAHL